MTNSNELMSEAISSPTLRETAVYCSSPHKQGTDNRYSISPTTKQRTALPLTQAARPQVTLRLPDALLSFATLAPLRETACHFFP